MSTLEQHLDDYLRLRRGLGYKLARDEQILPMLITHVRAAGASSEGVRASVCEAEAT